MATLKDMLELAGKAILEQHVDGNGDVKGDILAQAATVSLAVSAKRIADALEKLAEPVDDIVSGEQLDEDWIGRVVQRALDERLREAGRQRV